MRALTEAKYLTPTPIQAQAIPALLQGRDMLGIAQTGTGKTAAFALPMLQRLSEPRERPQPKTARALVLAPTRELAVQIADSVKIYGRNAGLKHTVVFGGVSESNQIRAMTNGIDILIATPGRLLDLVNRRFIRLDQVKYLVLDEADRMLDMGFIRDVNKIVAMVPAQRQSLLFSATMPHEISHLAAKLLRDPVRVEVTPQTVAVDRIEQTVYHVSAGDKRSLLTKLLGNPEMSRVIVFTRTKHGANKVTETLQKAGVVCDAIHGNKSQNARQRALNEFKAGRMRVLVATDIAARGIDVPNITHVVNFELPNISETYVHRIGRTARAGGAGAAISFCDGAERPYLKDIERLIKRTLSVAAAGPLPAREARAESDRGERRDERPRQHRGPGHQGRPNHQHGKPNGHGQGKKNGQRSHRGNNPHQGDRSQPAAGQHQARAQGQHQGQRQGQNQGHGQRSGGGHGEHRGPGQNQGQHQAQHQRRAA
ncbi:MAG: DEAD/DEAH box helicase [Rhodospirillaceae bacterium]|nr:DEAD/DEAH box helicase [Rhodospirillaceae bacterium]